MLLKQIEAALGRLWGTMSARRQGAYDCDDIAVNYMRVLRQLAEIDQQSSLRRRSGD